MADSLQILNHEKLDRVGTWDSFGGLRAPRDCRGAGFGIRRLADVVERADVRMIQRSDGACFAVETLAQI